MADLAMRIPSDQVIAVRASLLHLRAGIAEAIGAANDLGREACGHLVELRDAEEALVQLDPDRLAVGEPVTLSAHPELLSDVLHGALADATEAFDRACDADWRGDAADPPPAEALRRVIALFRLFEEVQGRER